MSWLDSMFGRAPKGPPAHAPAPAPPQQLALYKYDSCPYCQRVLRHIEQLGLDGVELRDTLRAPEHRRALLDATGRTTVPCLFIDGEPLFESLDINAWLTAYHEALAGDAVESPT